MLSYVTTLVSGLQEHGYNAYTNAQEKEEVKQVIVQMETANIEKETQASYRYTPSVVMRIECDNDSLDETIKDLIAIAEEYVTPTMIDFRITDIDINKFGTTNMLVITGQYIEIIQVTNI
jgi:hypothetical protein